MCRFDGKLGDTSVGLEAAHVRWHSQRGPDQLDNAVALCSLHHTLFDLGVLGLTAQRRVRVCELYRARSESGRQLAALAGTTLVVPKKHVLVDIAFIEWHARQVFKSGSY